MNEPHDPFLQVLELYKAAVRAKNVDAFLAIYDDNVHVFDMWDTWSLHGTEAWRAMAVDWFASLGTEQVVVSADEAQSTQIGELVVGHAIFTYTAMSAEGKALRSLDNRITMALRRTDDAWKIFHEHTSAPIDHRSMGAMLRRAGD